MSKGWKEIARLGYQGARFPHILVDAHGWCLRLGANRAEDEKYYSSLPNLLEGLVEHLVRRRLANSTPVESLRDLVREIRDALRATREMGAEALKRGVQERPIRLVVASQRKASPSTSLSHPPTLPAAVQDGSR